MGRNKWENEYGNNEEKTWQAEEQMHRSSKINQKNQEKHGVAPEEFGAECGA